jgi:hypothetical protein
MTPTPFPVKGDATITTKDTGSPDATASSARLTTGISDRKGKMLHITSHFFYT